MLEVYFVSSKYMTIFIIQRLLAWHMGMTTWQNGVSPIMTAIEHAVMQEHEF